MNLLTQRPVLTLRFAFLPFFLFSSLLLASCEQTTDKARIRKNAQVDFLDAVNVNLLAVSETANLDPAMLEAASSLLREGLRGGGGKLSEKFHYGDLTW
jgi:hypothetical protein